MADRSDTLILIRETYVKNEYGVQTRTETQRSIYCQTDSVTASEFYEGGRNGLNPELRFTVFAPDYMGERTVEYKGLRYGVYRSYLGRDDNLELYCERKGGTNGSS